MATILISHGVPMAGFEALQEHTIIVPKPLKAFTMEEMCAHIVHADAVIACGTLPGDVIRAGRQLKLIATYGAGYDRVDLAAAGECGVTVTNIPDAVTASTAELALTLMLSVSRRVGEMNLRLRREQPESLFGMGLNMGHMLRGRTLGIVGCGRIGRRVAGLAQAFGMRCISCAHRSPLPEGVEGRATLDDVLREADVLTLHCPLTDETRNLLDARAFSLMKRGAMLINTSRGGVVDTAALADALRSGRLAGAGLDVYPDEPHVPAELLAMENVVCTPHMGANTVENRMLMAHALSGQILAVLNGRRPENIVNGL